MRFLNYMITNESAAAGGVQKYFKELKKMPAPKAEKTLKMSWEKLSFILKDRMLENDAVEIINRNFHTNYKRLSEIDRAKIGKLPTKEVYEDILNEDFKHYFDIIKSEAFPALSFYPILQVFMELDKLIKGSGGDSKVIIFYGLMWLLLVSGKFVKEWKRWKKENPEEFKKEGSKKNPFSLNKKEFEFE